MKLLFDLFPLLIFFALYKTKDIYWATGALIAATAGQILWLLIVGVDERRWRQQAAVAEVSIWR